MGLIYIIKNNVNNKVYIGQTKQLLNKRWEHHLYLADKSDAILYRAMRKYKKENFGKYLGVHLDKILEVTSNSPSINNKIDSKKYPSLGILV